jgi:hypothetical protein
VALLGHAAQNFAERCVEGITATERGPELVEKGLMLATAFAPVIGSEEAARVLRPGGRVVVVDLGFTRRYARGLEAAGMIDVRRRDAGWRMWFWGPYLRAHIVTARK